MLNAFAAEPEGTVWAKYNNVIPTPTNTVSTDGRIPLGASQGDVTHVNTTAVILDESTYKMWYSGYSGVYRIYYATSSNGLDWTKYDNGIPAISDGSSTNGKIPLGTSGKGDGAYVYSQAVIKDGATYKMWYSGYEAAANFRIYYATSSNGLDWTKYDNGIPAISDGSSTNGKIPLGTSGKGDDARVYAPAVILDEGTYKMWYTGFDGSFHRIYYATSSNGLDWTKYDNGIPDDSNGSSTNGKIPQGTAGKGDFYDAGWPTVIKDGSTYKMWYAGNDGGTQRIYYATSSNGLTWTKYNNAVPADSDTTSTNGCIPLGTSSKGDVKGAAAPAVIKVRYNAGYTYYMWYAGLTNSYRIYHARTLPPGGTILTFH
ncbi:MAG: hypothetical protein HYV36_07465 [Lentisphaerae bacterium]|nr:hypothetical protein [Lentisphaerota bacterium]